MPGGIGRQQDSGKPAQSDLSFLYLHMAFESNADPDQSMQMHRLV